MNDDDFRASVLEVVDVQAEYEFDTGAHKTNRDGVPRYHLGLAYQGPDDREWSKVKVKFHSRNVPPEAIADLSAFRVSMAGIVARPWESEGRSGISVTAEQVDFQPINGAKQSAAA
jgi:hypothetical protein